MFQAAKLGRHYMYEWPKQTGIQTSELLNNEEQKQRLIFFLSQSCERSSVAFDGVQYLPPFQFIERERKTNCKLARYTFSVARASKVAAAAATTAIQSCPGDATSMGSWHAETAN